MKYINIIVAIVLLLCLAPMPYGFYVLVRFIAMIAFAWMAYQYSLQKKDNLMILFVALALLFQPFFKIALGREIWNVVDVIVAALLIFLWLKEAKSGDNSLKKS